MHIGDRRAALARVLEGFPVAYDRLLEAHGLRLPKHVAYAMGWWRGQTDAERDWVENLFGTGPIGVAAWLCEGRFDRIPERASAGPREMLGLFADDDGRWALWYDDPSELPRTLFRFEGDEAMLYQPTLLASLDECLSRRFSQNDPLPESEELDELFAWFHEVGALEREALRAEQIVPAMKRAIRSDGFFEPIPRGAGT